VMQAKFTEHTDTARCLHTDRIAAMKAEREEWEAKRQSSSASAPDVRSPAVNRSVRSAIAAAGSLQSSSSMPYSAP
jgi:hypothetical protein